MRTPASEISLTSVLAFEDPAGTARKIPNRKLFPVQFTMASDASETTVASYGLSGRLKDFQFMQALLPHEVSESSTYREINYGAKDLFVLPETASNEVGIETQPRFESKLVSPGPTLGYRRPMP
jgi:hypothetical protein